MRSRRGWTAILAVLLFACGNEGIPGSGVSATRECDVSAGFERVEVRGAGSVEITIAETPTLTITVDDNLIDLIGFQVTDDRLLIQPPESISPKVSLVYRIGVPKLLQLTTLGTVSADAMGIQGDDLTLVSLGAGSITATGKVEHLNVSVKGGGSVDLAKLEAVDGSVSISGAGSAEVNVTKTLSGVVSGVGSINYHGHPQVEKSVSGGGSIARAKD